MTNGTLGRVQAILTQMAKPASNGESGKKWQRVGKNLNEALRGALCKVVKLTKIANLTKMANLAKMENLTKWHWLGEYSHYMKMGEMRF